MYDFLLLERGHENDTSTPCGLTGGGLRVEHGVKRVNSSYVEIKALRVLGSPQPAKFPSGLTHSSSVPVSPKFKSTIYILSITVTIIHHPQSQDSSQKSAIMPVQEVNQPQSQQMEIQDASRVAEQPVRPSFLPSSNSLLFDP